MRRFTGFRWRVFLSFAPFVLILTGLFAGYLFTVARGVYREAISAQLASEAKLVALYLAPRWGDASAMPSLAETLGLESNTRVTVLNPAGQVLADSTGRPVGGNLADRPEVRAALAHGTARTLRPDASTGKGYSYAATRVEVNGAVVGVARVARPLDAIDEPLIQLAWSALGGVIASTMLAGWLAFGLARVITAPIQAITKRAEALAAGDLGTGGSARSQGEVGDLEYAFERMARQLVSTIQLISAERSKLAAVVETLDDGLVMIDGSGAIVMANSAAERLLAPGRPRGRELTGRPFALVARDHELLALVRAAVEAGRAGDVLVESHRPRRTIRAAVAPVRDDRATLVLLVLHDLTELRRLETARRDFVANISHELRTPLASIKALVETLEGGAVGDERVARRFLQQVNDEVDHLAVLVRDLLELSRLESGETPLARVAVSPRLLLEEARERLHAQAAQTGITIELAAAPDAPAVWADTTRVSQVLLNLLHNAIKFTPRGGRITLGAETREETVAFHVSDTGSGVDPDLLPRIFERFFKADRARASAGTGLGLAIAKHLVTAHGGVLSATNNDPPPGSTFTFTLPRVTVSQPAGQPATSLRP